MIHGMTAYSQREIKSDWGTAVWEIRSVNQRFLEIYFRLPEQFRCLEPVIRNRIRSCLMRGKIDCILHLEQDDLLRELIFNKNLAKQLISAAKWIQIQSNGGGEIDPVNILSWPGVMVVREKNFDMITSELIISFEDTLKDYIKVRETEGKIIKVLIEQRLRRIDVEVKKVRSFMPEILKWQRERLISKLENVASHLENNRLEQELILIAQRIDVHEELDRISAHTKEIYNLLNKEESAVGRRIDFIIQELNRESNTLASKSINTDITNSAIELKVLIEQMREQVQNIE